MTAGPFRGKTAAWLVGIVAVSFTASILLIAFGEEFDQSPSARADTTSRSALGHKAFVEVLKSIGVPVVVSRFDSERKAGTSALLVIAEPNLGSVESDSDEVRSRRRVSLKSMLERDGEVLLVLPKWQGEEDPDRRAWIRAAQILPTAAVNEVLDVLFPDGRHHVVVGPAYPDVSWGAGDIQIAPTLGAEAQWLMDSPGMEAIVWQGSRVLVGMVQRAKHRTYVLTDPDVLSTHGLGRGDNALFSSSVVDLARGSREAVVFDETLHGVEATPNVWRAMFRFPLVLVLIQALIGAAILLWAATGRFGAPTPETPALDAGKRFLVENTADLMQFGGHAAGALDRYWKTTVQDVARATHAPPHLPRAELEEWLGRAGGARGVHSGMQDLEKAVERVRGDGPHESKDIVATAAGIHRWRREMIDGSSDDS